MWVNVHPECAVSAGRDTRALNQAPAGEITELLEGVRPCERAGHSVLDVFRPVRFRLGEDVILVSAYSISESIA